MSEMLFLVIVIVGIVLLLSIFVGGSSAYPYVKAGPLLSPAEANFISFARETSAFRPGRDSAQPSGCPAPADSFCWLPFSHMTLILCE